jgi:hypothetical protein
VPFLVLVGGLFLAGLAYVVLSRANELFCVSIRDGACLVIRGRVPPKLWRELVTTAEVNGLTRGTVRAVREGGAARLVTDGISPEVTQRLRNGVGSAGLNAMRFGSTGRDTSRNLGQLLGIAWLAWLLHRR